MSENNELMQSLTSEVEVEQLLRKSAACDLFGPPPRNLVEDAIRISVLQEPCRERERRSIVQRSSALIVMTLAAAGMIVAALPVSNVRSGAHASFARVRPSLKRLPIENGIAVATSDPPGRPWTSLAEAPARSSAVAQVSVKRFRRRHAYTGYRSSPKPMWTTTVVSESEQGIVIPVVAVASNEENESGATCRAGVAIVPLQTSGLTYTEYPGPP